MWYCFLRVKAWVPGDAHFFFNYSFGSGNEWRWGSGCTVYRQILVDKRRSMSKTDIWLVIIDRYVRSDQMQAFLHFFFMSRY